MDEYRKIEGRGTMDSYRTQHGSMSKTLYGDKRQKVEVHRILELPSDLLEAAKYLTDLYDKYPKAKLVHYCIDYDSYEDAIRTVEPETDEEFGDRIANEKLWLVNKQKYQSQAEAREQALKEIEKIKRKHDL